MPPDFISLMLIMSTASLRTAVIASWGEWTDSSAMIGMGAFSRTCFRPSQSQEGTGCSQNSQAVLFHPAQGADGVGGAPSLIAVDPDVDRGAGRLADARDALDVLFGDLAHLHLERLESQAGDPARLARPSSPARPG